MPHLKDVFILLSLVAGSAWLTLSICPGNEDNTEAVSGFFPACPPRGSAPGPYQAAYPVPGERATRLSVLAYHEPSNAFRVQHHDYPDLTIHVPPNTGCPAMLDWIEISSRSGRLGILVYAHLDIGTSAMVHVQEAQVYHLRTGELLGSRLPVAIHLPPAYGEPTFRATSWNLYADRIEILSDGERVETLRLQPDSPGSG